MKETKSVESKDYQYKEDQSTVDDCFLLICCCKYFIVYCIYLD
jgi:hypothetical protein